MPAPVYKEKGHLPMQAEFKRLEALCTQLRAYAPIALCDQLNEALVELRVATRTDTTIAKGSMQLGYGVNKAKKAIACDMAIAIIRQIKALKAW